MIIGSQILPDQPAKPEKLGVAPIQQSGVDAPRRLNVALARCRFGRQQQDERRLAQQQSRPIGMSSRFARIGRREGDKAPGQLGLSGPSAAFPTPTADAGRRTAQAGHEERQHRYEERE